MIYSARLRQARELRGLSQSDIAKQLGVAQALIAQVETGRKPLAEDHLTALVLATGFPPAFFREPPIGDFPEGTLLYRSLASMTARDREGAYREAELRFEVMYRLSKKVKAPPVRVPRLEDESADPVAAARLTRSALGLSPDMPIGNLMNVLEKAGIWIFNLSRVFPGCDAFSTWTSGVSAKPIIAFSPTEAGDRLRSTLAHELGHLVIHHALAGSIKSAEREAQTFAAAFLLPEEAMLREITTPVTLTSLSSLKPRWGVSLQMLIRRARDLQVVTERQYSYLNQQIGLLGWKKAEPANLAVPVEHPRALASMAAVATNAKGAPLDYRKIAAQVLLLPQQVRSIIEGISDETTSAEVTQMLQSEGS